MRNRRHSVYRNLFLRGLQPAARIFLKSKLAIEQRTQDEERFWKEAVPQRSSDLKKAPERKCLWFHAASAGELESLWAIMEAVTEREPLTQLVVSIFSPSARKPLERLMQSSLQKNILWAGYSPLEGSWKSWLQAIRPQQWVSAKYEAWPELWISASELGIPVSIVGALSRSSLQVAARACQLLGVPLPRLRFLSFEESEVLRLRANFPSAEVSLGVDPRWARVAARMREEPSRVREIEALAENLPRPWLVMGSAWDSDLQIWREAFQKMTGTIWIVPHVIQGDSYRKMRHTLNDFGHTSEETLQEESSGKESKPSRSATVQVIHEDQSKRVFRWVNEMGFLSEFYRLADFVYVGGGFEEGVHSTIEPAIQGVPISIGPHGAEKFSEIAQLRNSGQLQILHSAEEVCEWAKIALSESANNRMDWKAEAEARVRAASTTFDWLLRHESACYFEHNTEK